MSKVIIHIGTHKTATTTIQERFWSFAPEISDRGIVYPLLNHIPGHHGLTALWSPVGDEFELPQGAKATFEQICTDYADSDFTVVLSSEEFSRAGPRGGVNYKELRQHLEAFDEVQVVCVLRQQWSFMQSVYLELSKSISPPRPPVLLTPALNHGVFAGLWADYTMLLDRLEDAFGPENVTLMEFDACRKSEGGVMGSMLRFLGLNPEDEDLKPMMSGASNVSPPALASWAGNIVSEPKAAPAWLLRRAEHYLQQEYGLKAKHCLFTRVEFDRLKEHFDPLNAELVRRRKPYQPDFEFSPASREALSLFREDIGVTFWLHFCRNLAQEILSLEGVDFARK
ncbi:hypothetical protein [Thalassovita taeanensis]|uniref:Sulfotransferase domain-containing protein n=1 Tax=Thalassovita taeanensis TaxID=657014 RepID=A0A1H9KZV9_9RHOB|nr:hypothetical protein [Thalassovita taeanensis]SER04686.1 hypothetical protein SAMN04488092_1222 [Thalassovita taeanensis]